MGSKSPVVVMTPLHIEIALHYSRSKSSEVTAYVGRDSDATARIHRQFADAGLLEFAGDSKHWKATELMRRYVENLCRVSLPSNHPGVNNDGIAQLEAVMNERNKDIGEATINTRNYVIAAVMDEYWASTPLAKL